MRSTTWSPDGSTTDTSLLDAMACGKPIVATTAGGIPEVVQHGKTGFLVPPRDHHAMAEGIVKLLKDEQLRQRMGAAGLSLVNAKFSAERMVQETLSAYQRVSIANRQEPTPKG